MNELYFSLLTLWQFPDAYFRHNSVMLINTSRFLLVPFSFQCVGFPRDRLADVHVTILFCG